MSDSILPRPPCLGNRHGQILLMFCGLLMAYALRVNLSVGIVAMKESKDHPVKEWNNNEQGMMLSSFFWGYLVLQIPAGMLATRFGPVKLFGGSTVLAGVITVLTPLAAQRTGWGGVCAIRIILGLSQGFVYPCANTHLSKWATPSERSTLFSFAFGGTQVGAMLMLLTGGLLAGGPGGWPMIFYVSGGVSILWGIICIIWGADSPEKHRTISPEEKEYIVSSLVHNTAEVPMVSTPWLDIVKSVPMWALLAAHMGNCWGFWTLLTLMPTYIHGVLKFDIQTNGALSALPYFVMWIGSIIFGILADWLVRRKILSVNVSRKLWNTIAHWGEALALLGLAYLDVDVVGAIALLTVAVTINAGTYMGYLTNHIDLSPNLAGTLMGITNCISNISSILGPLISSIIVNNQSDRFQWRIVFLISAAIFFVGNSIFILFGSTAVQPWNEPKRKQKPNENLNTT